MTAEIMAPPQPEVQAGQRADAELHRMNQTQDRRLRRWAKWFVGGIGLQALGVGAAFVPFAGIPIAITLWSLGGASELVGTVGLIGNVIRGKKKN